VVVIFVGIYKSQLFAGVVVFWGLFYCRGLDLNGFFVMVRLNMLEKSIRRF
jgi:hypothetical protein